jgi:hypothetical protein
MADWKLSLLRHNRNPKRKGWSKESRPNAPGEQMREGPDARSGPVNSPRAMKWEASGPGEGMMDFRGIRAGALKNSSDWKSKHEGHDRHEDELGHC